MKVSVNLKGFRELEDALAELPKATAKNVLRRAGMAAMGKIEARAKQLAPKDDGELAESIVTRPVRAKRVSRTRFAAASGVEIATGPAPARGSITRANASWQENGNVNHGPTPYMRPSAHEEGKAVVDELAAELTVQVGKAAQRAARKAAKKASQ